jgi:hypothetical protein
MAFPNIIQRIAFDLDVREFKSEEDVTDGQIGLFE